MFTCAIRYVVDLEKLSEFEEYARTWIGLIRKYGGTHHGYFLPGDAASVFPNPSFSFEGLGVKGPDNIAIALFSFHDVDAYQRYRELVKDDPECVAATARFSESKCFSSYERVFLRPVF